MTTGPLNDETETLPSSLQEKVIDKINLLFGSDLSRLSKLDAVTGQLDAQAAELDARLEAAASRGGAQTDEGRVGELVSSQARLLGDIATLRGVTQYTTWVTLLQELDTKLGTAAQELASSGGRESAVANYNLIKQVRNELKTSQCLNLKKYAEELCTHWFNILHEKLAELLDAGLKSLGWPFIQLEDKSKSLESLSSCCSILELQSLTLSLLQLQDSTDGQGEEEDRLSLPMKVMLKPLRTRFKFHFLGSKSTADPGKPEWFTTQLLQWASLHRPFLETHIQPVYSSLALPLPATTEFSRGLVSLARERLTRDLPLLHQDDLQLAHTIDEAISFAREMAGQLQYGRSQPSALRPLTDNPAVFNRWINMERKFAFEKLDLVIAGEGAWEPEAGCEGLVPRAAQHFLAVLLAVTERYKFLALTQHRLQFLELQLQLLEDFRLRLVQLMSPEAESVCEGVTSLQRLTLRFCPILCTVEHLSSVLTTWGETPFFLQLASQKQAAEQELGQDSEQESTSLSSTVFEETISKLEYVRKEMVGTLVSSILHSVREASEGYRTEVRWWSIREEEVTEVQPQACSLIQVLVFQLSLVRAHVPPATFLRVWQPVARLLGTFLAEELVLANRWGRGGGRQLERDVSRGLLPVIGEFTTKPEAHFPVLMDCIKLLTASPAVLMLARDTIKEGGLGAKNTLTDLNVSRLTLEQAMSVINARVDLNIM